MKTRLFHCTGYHSAIILVSSIKTQKKLYGKKEHYEDILFLEINKQSEEVALAIINKIYAFSKIYIATNAEILKSPKIFYEIKNNHPQIDEYWACHFGLNRILNSYHHLDLKDFFNYKSFILYEEGFASYIEPYILHNGITKIDSIFILNKSLVGHIHLSKYVVHQIDESIYLTILNELSNALISNNLTSIDENSVLFISSTLWEEDKELQRANQEIIIINKLIEKEGPVFYKKHPRSDAKFIAIIANAINKKEFFHIIDNDYPIELFLIKQKPKFIIFFFSSIGLSSYNIFQIPSFTYHIKNIEEDLGGHKILKDIVNIFFPNIENYWESNSKYSPTEYYLNFTNNTINPNNNNFYLIYLNNALENCKNYILQLEKQLSYSIEKLHHTKEELQNTKEELRHTKEELQNTKEELRHTKEELQNTKEKLEYNLSLTNQLSNYLLQMEWRAKKRKIFSSNLVDKIFILLCPLPSVRKKVKKRLIASNKNKYTKFKNFFYT